MTDHVSLSEFPSKPLCMGCGREFKDGDIYIEDTSAGFLKQDAEPEIDSLIAEIFGAKDGKIRFCEDCTQRGGDYQWQTFTEADRG